MSLGGLTSQLRSAQDVAKAGSAMRSVSGAFNSVAAGAKNMAGDAQMRAGLLQKKSGEPALPSDGSVCEGCGKPFGGLTRKSTCNSCDRYLCGSCLGSSTLASMGLSCLCATSCPRCKEQGQQASEFETHMAEMQRGVAATMSVPKGKSSGLFRSSSQAAAQKMGIWLSLDRDSNELRWATLEQRSGAPVEEGRWPIVEVLAVRNTGMAMELVLKGQTQATVVDFSVPVDRESWTRYVQLAIDVLVPESQRAEHEAARNHHRQGEIHDRQKQNEERKKKLSEGLGMRFTAEAMMNRDSK